MTKRINIKQITSPFWQEKTLAKMTAQEWELLCDGCGKCCLSKLIDDDTDELHYTNVACKLLNTKSCQCKKYDKRFKHVPDCIKVSLDNIDQFQYLPGSCAYRRLAEGKPLPEWHPLLTGSTSAMHAGGHSVRGKVITEFDEIDLQDHIATWPTQ
ncbi:YcgN family cysteine cluster protein [Motilimonas eburnea]|uniref:YcgN family cysteine cluster protein n=1 Tax=Motilimonas eburnea TaxID=1737488 RepID=UPI001E6174B1|nr:YcgN family cysteine cluster protein [Motilimonas eburnea]MCE2571915.1 YcgN family cysteine cluster protein [Motilimonas eburnea]